MRGCWQRLLGGRCGKSTGSRSTSSVWEVCTLLDLSSSSYGLVLCWGWSYATVEAVCLWHMKASTVREEVRWMQQLCRWPPHILHDKTPTRLKCYSHCLHTAIRCLVRHANAAVLHPFTSLRRLFFDALMCIALQPGQASGSQRRRTMQRFTSRCHVYDICQTLMASMENPRPGQHLLQSPYSVLPGTVAACQTSCGIDFSIIPEGICWEPTESAVFCCSIIVHMCVIISVGEIMTLETLCTFSADMSCCCHSPVLFTSSICQSISQQMGWDERWVLPWCPGAVYNVVDDDPASRAEVMGYAKQLLGAPASSPLTECSTKSRPFSADERKAE